MKGRKSVRWRKISDGNESKCVSDLAFDGHEGDISLGLAETGSMLGETRLILEPLVVKGSCGVFSSSESVTVSLVFTTSTLVIGCLVMATTADAGSSTFVLWESVDVRRSLARIEDLFEVMMAMEHMSLGGSGPKIEPGSLVVVSSLLDTASPPQPSSQK